MGGATSGKNGELLYLFFVRIHTNCIIFLCLPPGLLMTAPSGLGRSERPQGIFERPPGGARPQDFRPGANRFVMSLPYLSYPYLFPILRCKIFPFLMFIATLSFF